MTVAPWNMKSRPQMMVSLKAAFLENYLAVSTWILNESLIKYHEKKHQQFSLSGVRFGSRAIKIYGVVENELPTLHSFLQHVVTANAKPIKSFKFAILSHQSFVMGKTV